MTPVASDHYVYKRKTKGFTLLVILILAGNEGYVGQFLEMLPRLTREALWFNMKFEPTWFNMK